MQSLPAELKRHIVELSSGSPSSLAALARTHTAFQGEAEKALYETLHISANNINSLKCMHTLVTNPEKAALVRFLTVEIQNGDNTVNPKMLTYLSRGLINMHCLSDFRVRSRPHLGEKIIKCLAEILWSVCNILILSKLTILVAIQSGSFSITNFVLPRRFRHFSHH